MTEESSMVKSSDIYTTSPIIPPTENLDSMNLADSNVKEKVTFEVELDKGEVRGAYDPLDKEKAEIRLLFVSPSENFNDPINAYLVHVSMNTGLRTTDGINIGYYALSYTWGAPDPPATIYIDNKEFKVRQNLHQALKRFRADGYVPLIWVDAVCINQKDNTEKLNQISFMDSIYKKAARVIVWLGEKSENSDLALNLIDIWHSELKEINNRLRAGLTDMTDLKEKWRELIMLDKYDRHWAALGQLLRRPYWYRVWIMQEILLNDNVRIWCGDKSTSWYVLTKLLNSINETSINRTPRRGDDLKEPGLATELATIKENWQDPCKERPLSLTDALVLGRRRFATVSVDKVYGILSLTSEVPDALSYNDPAVLAFRKAAIHAISADENLNILSACKSYKIKNQQLYDVSRKNPNIARTANGWGFIGYMNTDILACKSDFRGFLKECVACTQEVLDEEKGKSKVAQESKSEEPDGEEPVTNLEAREKISLYIEGDEGSEMLEDCLANYGELADQLKRCQSQCYQLPSWVPDWTNPIHRDRCLMFNETKRRVYNAGGNQKPLVNDNLRMPYIGIKGFQFCSIQDISMALPPRALSVEVWKSWWIWYRSLPGVPNPYGDRNATKNAFCNICALGLDAEGKKDSASKLYYLHGLSFKAGFEFPFEDAMDDENKGSCASQDSKLHSMQNIGENASWAVENVQNDKNNVHNRGTLLAYTQKVMTWGFHIFVTKQGYLGKCDAWIEENDLICILQGGKTPFILRPDNEGAHYLIGECYIQGIMKGEALDRPHEMKEIVLR